ncbi:hypothetical protein ALC56_12974 [Trachymyrmex septentrionalis]|uniref:Uncharacterized protein n=1 Tax=Trachymyrmex septentrionalis TaxID=34720 RepID=A0A195EWP4_9HYME|nr:hypothetical protein ALC56_12974 [Trachymyrmex septentrionalis]
MLSFASQYFLVSRNAHAHAHVRTRVQTVAEANRCPGLDEIKPSGGYYDDGGGGGRGGDKAWRRERRKEGCPSPRWQPSASRVQGRIINLFFTFAQKTKRIDSLSPPWRHTHTHTHTHTPRSMQPTTTAAPLLSPRITASVILAPSGCCLLPRVSLRNGTFFFLYRTTATKKKRDDFEIFKVMKYAVTRGNASVKETLPARLPVLRNDRMNQIWRYINVPNYAESGKRP